MYEIRKWVNKPILKEVLYTNINFQALEETLAEIKSLRAAKKFDEARKQMQYLRQDLMGRRVERMARSLDE